jgi:hypothetical protein
MKKTAKSSFSGVLFLIPGLFLLNFSVSGQESSGKSPALPDNVNKIVTVSCMPCHTSNGGLLPRSKLNFTKWTEYSPSQQKAKAEEMYSVLNKGIMPPKSVREIRPDIIPTKDQVDIIKKWEESLNE